MNMNDPHTGGSGLPVGDHDSVEHYENAGYDEVGQEELDPPDPEPPAKGATKILNLALKNPFIFAGGVAGVVAIVAFGFVWKGVTSIPPSPAGIASSMIKPTAPESLPASRADMSAALAKIAQLQDTVAALTQRPKGQEQLGAMSQRLAALEATSDALKQNAMATPVASAVDAEALKKDIDNVKAAVFDLATLVDQRLAVSRAVASHPIPALKKVAAKKRSYGSRRDALPIEAAPGDPRTAGTTTGSPSRGFIFGNTRDAGSLKAGDEVPGYGRVIEARKTSGGVLIMTETGQIFVRDKAN